MRPLANDAAPTGGNARPGRAVGLPGAHWPDPVFILGVRVDPVTMTQAVAIGDDLLAMGGHHHVVTVNPEYIMAARRDSTFAAVLQRADLALADGVGIILAARCLGARVPARVTGVDIVPRLVASAAHRRQGVFLLGAAPGVAERAADALAAFAARAGAPPLQVVGCLAGSPDARAAPEIVARVRGARPGLLLVAFGAPRQDLWIDEHGRDLAVPLMMGVGGTFDFLAGVQKRAPRVVQCMGLEWLWRLALQPWRWRRQLALPQFAALVVGAAMRRHSSSAAGPPV